MTDLAIDDRPVLAGGGDRKLPAPGKRKFQGRRIILMIFLILLALSFLTPALWMLNASLRPEEHVMDFPPGFALSHPQWGNYATVLRNMPVYFLNSVKLAVLNVVGGLIVSSLAGYAFARSAQHDAHDPCHQRAAHERHSDDRHDLAAFPRRRSR